MRHWTWSNIKHLMDWQIMNFLKCNLWIVFLELFNNSSTIVDVHHLSLNRPARMTKSFFFSLSFSSFLEFVLMITVLIVFIYSIKHTNIKNFLGYGSLHAMPFKPCQSCTWSDISSAESQKGLNALQRCSAENQKGASAKDFVQWQHPSGSQCNIFEQH